MTTLTDVLDSAIERLRRGEIHCVDSDFATRN